MEGDIELPTTPAQKLWPARLKKFFTYSCVALFFLAGGVEYSVVFPTMLDYLQQKGGDELLYGVTVAGFSISNMIAAPIYGVMFDKTHKTKSILLVANLFEIGGECSYVSAQMHALIGFGVVV